MTTVMPTDKIRYIAEHTFTNWERVFIREHGENFIAFESLHSNPADRFVIKVIDDVERGVLTYTYSTEEAFFHGWEPQYVDDVGMTVPQMIDFLTRSIPKTAEQ